MWLYLSSEELKLLQRGLDLLAEKEGAVRGNLWAKIQRRMESEKAMKPNKKAKKAMKDEGITFHQEW